jgi:DNA-directed RNA polymerase subunit RPC12/RpoP
MIYFQEDKEKITKCPRCGSIAYTTYASAIHRYYKCEKCKINFKLSEVAARYFAKNKKKPECPRCGNKITSISIEGNYLQDSGQKQKKTDGKNKNLDSFGLKTW